MGSEFVSLMSACLSRIALIDDGGGRGEHEHTPLRMLRLYKLGKLVPPPLEIEALRPAGSLLQ
jgi:hypothetical protein